jgi:hypothetical protein
VPPWRVSFSQEQIRTLSNKYTKTNCCHLVSSVEQIQRKSAACAFSWPVPQCRRAYGQARGLLTPLEDPHSDEMAGGLSRWLLILVGVS